MTDKIKEYDDNLKLFFDKVLSSLDYLEGIPEEFMNELIFSFVPEYYEKGSIIFKNDDEADSMFVI
jgi:hypothetical protein